MSATNKGFIPYRSHKITLPDLGPIEFEQLDLPQLPSNVTLEKLLELAKQTTCNYLDVNQYLVYPLECYQLGMSYTNVLIAFVTNCIC